MFSSAQTSLVVVEFSSTVRECYMFSSAQTSLLPCSAQTSLLPWSLVYSRVSHVFSGFQRQGAEQRCTG